MKFWLWLLLPLLVFSGCGKSPARAGAAGKIKVFVSVPPQAYFVKRIAGDRVEVHTLVPPGQDPHTYTATPKEIAKLAQATIYFRVGLPVEEVLLPKIQSANPKLAVVDTRQGINLLKSPAEPGETVGEELDPHIWMSPVLAIKQAETMRDTLIKLDPAGKSIYEKNSAAFALDLDKLDARLKKILAPVKGKALFVFHPAYGYFAREYGLKQTAVETGGKAPSAKQIAALIERAKAQGVKVIFVQPQFSRQSAQAVATAIGGAVLPLDDLAEDYLSNMNSVARQVESALAKQK